MKTRIVSSIMALIISMVFITIPNENALNIAVVAEAATEYTASVENITKKCFDDYIILYWDKVSSASTYRIYLKNEEGKYNKYSDVKLAKTKDDRIKCTINGLEPGTKYTFKIVPLKKSNNKYIKGKGKKITVSTKDSDKTNNEKISTKLPSPLDVGLSDYFTYDSGLSKKYGGRTYVDTTSGVLATVLYQTQLESDYGYEVLLFSSDTSILEYMVLDSNGELIGCLVLYSENSLTILVLLDA